MPRSSGCYECIEPQISNLFKRETLSGDFLQVNRYLVTELKELGLWNEEMRIRLKLSEGSMQKIDEIPDDLKLIYRTVWEIPMRSLIDMAAERGAFIDQSQSLNLFCRVAEYREALFDVHVRVEEGAEDDLLPAVAAGDEDCEDHCRGQEATRPQSAVACCSLENPGACEACQ